MPPGAIVLSQTRQIEPTQGSEGPEPGLLELLGAGARTAVDTWTETQQLRQVDGYARLGDALVERGIPRESLMREKGWLAQTFGSSNPAFDYSPDRVWQEVERARASDRKAFADIPKTRAEFEQWVMRRRGARDSDQRTMARAQGIAGNAAVMAGQSVADMADSDLGPLQFMVGGGGKTIAQAFLREAVIGGVQETVKQPERIANRQQLGEQTTAAEIAADIGGSIVVSGLFGAGGKFLGDNWDGIKAAPRELQEKAWGAILERTPGLREKVGSSIDWDALDPHLADIAEATIDTGRMTDAERGAIAALRRDAAIEGSNPFIPDGAGTKAHLETLGETLQGIINQTPAYVPKVRAPAARLRTGSSIATGVTGDAMQTVKARIGIVESNGSATARNPRSSAMGLYQFTDGTWLAYYKRRFGAQGLTDAQIIARKGDTGLQNTLMDDLLSDNAKALQQAGFAADPGNLYLAHFAGRKGATDLLGADPAAPAVQVLGQKVINANPFLKGKTAGDVIAWAHGKMGGKAPSPARAAGDVGASEVGSDIAAALDREMADTQAEIARIDNELQGSTGDLGSALDDIAPEPIPAIDSTPLPRMDTAPRSIDPGAAEVRSGAQVIGLSSEARAAMPELQRIVDNERSVSLNDPAALAARLGLDEPGVRAALQQLALDGKVVQSAKGTFARMPRRKDGPEDVFQFIAGRGGLRDNEGHDLGTIFEVERMVRWKRKPDANGNGGVPLAQPYRTTRPALIPGYGPIVRRETGMSVDDMGEQLWEAGYFGPYPDSPRPTESEVIALLQEAWGSQRKVYSIYDEADVAALEASRIAGTPMRDNPFASDFQSEEHFDYEWNQFNHEADSAFGIVLDEEAFTAAWGEYRAAGDGDITGAVLRAIQREIEDVQAREIAERGEASAADIIDEWEAALRQGGAAGDAEGAGPGIEPGDPGPNDPGSWYAFREEDGPLDPERWQAWDEPDGPAAVLTTDSMEHDLRVQVEVSAVETAAIPLSDLPPVQDGYVRMWHGGFAGTEARQVGDGGRWFSSSREYAMNFRNEQGDKALFYVDVPENHPAIDNFNIDDFTNIRRGVTASAELPEDIAVNMRRVDAGPTITIDTPANPAIDPAIAARQQQEAQLRAQAPMRSTAEQDGIMGSPLFDAVDQPMFRLDEEGDVVNPADLLAEFDDDADFLKTIRDCL